MKITYESQGWTLVGPSREQRYWFVAWENGATELTLYPEWRRTDGARGF